MRRTRLFRGLAATMAFLLLVTVAASTVMFENAGMINQALNVTTSQVIETGETTGDTTYYTNEYGTDIANKQTALMVEMAAAAENVTQAEEGNVLLKNDNNALPLGEGARVTIFGNGSYNSRYNKKKETSTVDAIPMMTFNAAMQKVFGEENVNITLAENVYSGLTQTTNTEVIEAPIADVTAWESTWMDDYNDAAIVVLTRWGSEDSETAMYAPDGSHYLGLQTNEKDLLAYSYTIAVDFGGFSLAGTLDLMADGTMTFTENGGGPISAGSITGSWVDNGDGTATLSYRPADIQS